MVQDIERVYPLPSGISTITKPAETWNQPRSTRSSRLVLTVWLPYRTVPYHIHVLTGRQVQNGKDKTTVVCERRRQQLNIVFLQYTCSYMQHSINDQHLGKFVFLSLCAPLVIVIYICVSVVILSPKKNLLYALRCMVRRLLYF